jgi:hypothetical protein
VSVAEGGLGYVTPSTRTDGHDYPTWGDTSDWRVSTFCMTNPPGAIPHPHINAFPQTPTGAFYKLPPSDITETTSTCGDTRAIYANLTLLWNIHQCGATMEGLCAPPVSLTRMMPFNCSYRNKNETRPSHPRCGCSYAGGKPRAQ